MTESGFGGVEDRLHTVKEVADIFSVDPATVRLWIREHKLDAMKVGKGYRISRAAMVIYANRAKV